MIKNVKYAALALLVILSIVLITCTVSSDATHGEIPEAKSKSYIKTQSQLKNYLKKDGLSEENRYAVVARIANNMLSIKDYNSVILFLTEWVENHPDDPYNAYWLLMTAHAYMESNANPMAAYYMERIINNYDDLIIQGKSIHFLCYQHLIQISTSPKNRISYFNQLVDKFPNDVNSTEIFYRLALEHENMGEWDQAILCLTHFLQREDCQTIRIAGYPNAYTQAKQLIDFNDSSKDWTFETLDALVKAVQKAIKNYDWRSLDKYRSKVNFFSVTWRQDITDTILSDDFTIRNFMTGNRIRYNEEISADSGPTEAFLRTTGWNSYLTVWYLYFRKVNFPADPDIHGRWEWAGIYYGEKI